MMHKTHKNHVNRNLTKRSYLAAMISAVVLGAGTIPAFAQQADVDIEPQPLENALIEFSTQTGVGIFARGEQVRNIQVKPVSGTMDIETALTQMLQGTGLSFQKNVDGTYVVISAPQSRTQSDRKSSGAARVEEIVVTARKREESVQDIPIAITALSAEDLRVAGIRNLSDMEGVVPGVNMGGGGNGVKKDSNPFIRGVGQRETKVTLDPAVGTYIDGIYLARTVGAMLDTVGVERVEVLRGPQGTLFGKNTTGGAISVTTIKPHEGFGGSVNVNVGNYGRSDAAFMLNVPIIEEKLLSRLTVSSVNSEGYFTNVVDNTKWGDDNRITGIGQIRWLPTDRLMFDLLAERTRIREKPRPQKCAVARPIDTTGNGNPNSPNYNPDHFDPLPITDISEIRESAGLPGFSELCQQSADLPQDEFASDLAIGNELMPEARYWVDTTTIGLTGTWDIGEMGPLSNTQLKSISSWREVKQIADEDLDAVGAPHLARIQPDFTENRQWSQEFQFTGSAFNDQVFYSTGLYYFAEKTPEDRLNLLAGSAHDPDAIPITPAEIPLFELILGVDIPDDTTEIYRTVYYEPTSEILRTENETYAWYGQFDYALTSQLQLTMGLRYTLEKRWSRYEKGYPDPFSMQVGAFGGVTGPGLNIVASGNTQEWKPIVDWIYGSGTYSRDELGNVITSFTSGHYAGDELSTRDEAWTPMLSLKYSLADDYLDGGYLNDAMIYITYSEGFHSGGVTSGAADTDSGFEGGGALPEPGWGVADPITFEPERVQNYELGFKVQAFDQRVQANVAMFYMDYTNMQLTSVGIRAGLPIPFVENAGKSVIQGFEGEFTFLPSANWRVMLNTAYTDADIKEWSSAQFNLRTTDGVLIGEPTYMDRSDEPMPRVPRWQAFLLTDYTFQLENGDTITPSIAARYTSEIYHGFDRGSFVYGKDLVTADAATFIDGRISYVSADGRVDVSLWGKNLTDKDDYLVGGIPLVDVTGATGQIHANPRTFGLEMTYRFGAE